MKKHEEAGWSEIWYAFRKARRTAAENGQDLPRWPPFLVSNPGLVPKEHALSQVEADAARVAGHVTSLEDDDATVDS